MVRCSAQIRQDHGAIRTRQNLRHVDDGDAVERGLLQRIGGKENAHLDGPDGEALGPEPRSSPVRNWALPRPNDQSLSVFSTMLTIMSVGGMPHERSSSAQSFRYKAVFSSAG